MMTSSSVMVMSAIKEERVETDDAFMRNMDEFFSYQLQEQNISYENSCIDDSEMGRQENEEMDDKQEEIDNLKSQLEAATLKIKSLTAPEALKKESDIDYWARVEVELEIKRMKEKYEESRKNVEVLQALLEKEKELSSTQESQLKSANRKTDELKSVVDGSRAELEKLKNDFSGKIESLQKQLEDKQASEKYEISPEKKDQKIKELISLNLKEKESYKEEVRYLKNQLKGARAQLSTAKKNLVELRESFPKMKKGQNKKEVLNKCSTAKEASYQYQLEKLKEKNAKLSQFAKNMKKVSKFEGTGKWIPIHNLLGDLENHILRKWFSLENGTSKEISPVSNQRNDEDFVKNRMERTFTREETCGFVQSPNFASFGAPTFTVSFQPQVPSTSTGLPGPPSGIQFGYSDPYSM